MRKSSAAIQLAIQERQSPVGKMYHPLKYLGEVSAIDCRKQLTAVASMPYPADPLVEPEFVGLTYYQVALIRQAELAARHGSLDSMEFISDRIMGKPAQVNVNVSAGESYTDFLKQIAEEEEKVIDVKPEEPWTLE